jgi:hypothetical protein
VAWISFIGGHSGGGYCWKQAMTHLRRTPTTGINKLVDKIVDDHVDESQKPSIIADFKLFALILGKQIHE